MDDPNYSALFNIRQIFAIRTSLLYIQGFGASVLPESSSLIGQFTENMPYFHDTDDCRFSNPHNCFSDKKKKLLVVMRKTPVIFSAKIFLVRCMSCRSVHWFVLLPAGSLCFFVQISGT